MGPAVASGPVDERFDQLVAFLRRPDVYPDASSGVELIETHISCVFLTDRHAYKLKKPVRFEFVDFSTLEARRDACQAELRLNRRLAPSVYLDILPVTRTPRGRLQLGDHGQTVDWLVKMRRLPADRTLEALIASGRLSASDVESIGAMLADFYSRTPPLTIHCSEYRREIEHHVEANRAELIDPEHGLSARHVAYVHAQQLRMLRVYPDWFERRVADGRVVDGHGDLRPEHVYLVPNPVVIDCIEFSSELRTIDVLDELSFLAMECERLGARDVGRRIEEAYFRASGDRPHHAMRSFYKAYRACVRAKVAMLRARQMAPAERREETELAEAYLALAVGYVADLGPPLVIVICGRSGTGKSTLAEPLAAALGVDWLRTDGVRRELFGAETQAAAFGRGVYTDEKRQAVYDRMIEQADALLADRLSVVLDGTYSSDATRQAVCDLAQRRGAKLLFVYCECPREVALERAAEREVTGESLSQAGPEIVRQQSDDEAWLESVTSMRIDTTEIVSLEVQAVEKRLRELDLLGPS